MPFFMNSTKDQRFLGCLIMNFRTDSRRNLFRICLLALLLTTSKLYAGEDMCGTAIGQMEGTLTSWVSGDAEQLVPSVIYRLEQPGSAVLKENAFGLVIKGGQAVAAQTPFYIASMSKTMVASVVLKIMERKNIALDTPLGQLDMFTDDMLERLHVYEGKSYGSRITVRQLLRHTSGLKDYLLDDRSGIGADSEMGFRPGSLIGAWFPQIGEYADCISGSAECPEGTDPKNFYPGRQWAQWSPRAWQADPDNRDAGLLNFYLAVMADSALFVPGSARHYSDTNYMILGLVIEHLTGKNLGEALVSELFQPLGMEHSWLSYSGVGPLSDTPEAADFDAAGFMLLSLNADTSWDWGGGGVVSTARDLTIFVRALMQGRIFSKTETNEALKQLIPTLEDEKGIARGYGLGVRYIRDSEAGELWGHTGAWGSIMFYAPVLDIAMAATINKGLAHGMQDQLTHLLATAAGACSTY